HAARRPRPARQRRRRPGLPTALPDREFLLAVLPGGAPDGKQRRRARALLLAPQLPAGGIPRLAARPPAVEARRIPALPRGSGGAAARRSARADPPARVR